MNPHDFISVAHTLLAGPTEAAWRSAVSRAYYAAFHVGRDLLDNLRFTVPRGERAHGYLWLRLSNCGNVQVQEAGRRLNELRSRRNHADYDLGVILLHSEANRIIRLAEQVIRVLDAAPVEPLRTQITDAMKLYERNVLRDVTWHP